MCGKALADSALRTTLPPDASACIAGECAAEPVRPEGFEPPTLGSEDRCASDVKSSRDKDLRQPPKGEVPTVVPSCPKVNSKPYLPALGTLGTRLLSVHVVADLAGATQLAVTA